MLHGHCHGKLGEYNLLSPDLRFDVGIDGELSHRCEGFISVEAVYEAVMEKTKGNRCWLSDAIFIGAVAPCFPSNRENRD